MGGGCEQNYKQSEKITFPHTRCVGDKKFKFVCRWRKENLSIDGNIIETYQFSRSMFSLTSCNFIIYNVVCDLFD